MRMYVPPSMPLHFIILSLLESTSTGRLDSTKYVHSIRLYTSSLLLILILLCHIHYICDAYNTMIVIMDLWIHVTCSIQ